MKGVIKGVLAEELQNSLRMKKDYEKALRKLPKGCLAARKIRGHEYFYLVKRINGKVKYIYKGKISEQEKERCERAKRLRAKYRNLISKLKKRIKFLNSSLRSKEII